MVFRRLFLLVILLFPGIIEYILPVSIAADNNILIINAFPIVNSSAVNPDLQDTIVAAKQKANEYFVASFNPDMVIQLGAFRQEVNAIALRDKLAAVLDKPVIVLPEEGFFKVRVIKFKSLLEIERIIPTLGLLGYSQFWVFTPKNKSAVKPVAVPMQDTSRRISVNSNKVVAAEDSLINTPIASLSSGAQLEDQADTTLMGDEMGHEPPPVYPDSTSLQSPIILQVAIFFKRADALQAQRKIINKLKLPAKVIGESNYFRLIITGFSTKEETYKFYPELTKLGYPSSYMIESNSSK
jgi:beta-phosphoglucomutase-like phosphatase (HAD superfamily)